MIKNINVKLTDLRKILPKSLGSAIGNKMTTTEGFRNNFEVIEFVPCNRGAGRFLCAYVGKFFTIPIEHTRKL